MRSEAGGQTDRFGSVDDDDDDDDDDEPPRAKKSKQQNYHNNAHWLQPPSLSEPSNYVAYYDAAALYPSSGK